MGRVRGARDRATATAAGLAAATAVAAVLAVPAGAAPQDLRPGPLGGPVDPGVVDAPPGPGFSGFPGEPPAAGEPVWPGLDWDSRTTQVSGGSVDVNVVHFDPAQPGLQLRPLLAGGVVPGLATVADQGGDPLVTRAVAGVNGAFWLDDPVGDPNGLFAIDGRLISEPESQGAEPRAAFGMTPEGRFLVDRLGVDLQVDLAGGTEVPVRALNRGHREHTERFGDGPDSVLVYSPEFGLPVHVTRPQPVVAPYDPDPDDDPATPPPPQPPPPPPVRLGVFRLAADRWPSAGAAAATVAGITRDEEATFAVAPGELLLVTTGAWATATDHLAVGDPVTLRTRLEPIDGTGDWSGVTTGLTAGPHLVQDGALVDPAVWEAEGFSPSTFSNVRAPRTAIGVTAAGELLLVMADGRRPGITVGFTIGELARYLRALGAVDALALDGGASSQLVVDGVVRNVPCCDATTRRVADALYVSHDYTFTATQRLAGAGRAATAAAIARAAHPDGAGTAVLAVASGFADALAGGPLAAELDAPLLLIGSDGVPEPTAEALADLGADRVRLLGGEAVILPQVADALSAAGLQVTRLSGESRVETAVAVADAATGGRADRAFVAWAGGFADALAAGGPGGLLGMPILLTGSDALHPATASWLLGAGVDEAVLVGGPARLSEQVAEDLAELGLEVTRLAGETRYGTARAVNEWLRLQVPTLDPTGLIVANAGTFPDALAGGPLAAARRQALMIVPPRDVTADPDSRAFLESSGLLLDRVTLLGGAGVLGSYAQLQLEQLALGGPL